ncbi:NRDE protein-domain-containing protein [Chiua virens]|nr:NRDE protein-domain-containing protein [Chiua virens]
MCVAFFTLNHPDYALILCSNRDECLTRPTQPASFHSFGAPSHDQQPHILSGIDLIAGGTWLGLSRTGKLALLTNITEPPPPIPFVSRGCLLSSFLTAPSSVRARDEDVRRLVPYDGQYAGFNLLLLSPSPASSALVFDALYTHNDIAAGFPTGSTARTQTNGPRYNTGLASLEALLTTLPPNVSEDELTEGLFHLLRWRSSQPPRDRFELKNTIEVDPLRIANDYYGTRLSTVVLVTRTGEVVFSERDMWMLGEQEQRPILADPSSQRVFRFQLEL